MQKQYVYLAVPFGLEIKVVASRPIEANQKAWDTLTAEQKDRCEALDCVDIKDMPTGFPAKLVDYTIDPWLVDGTYVYADDALGRTIADCAHNRSRPRDEQRANARLVASAPDGVKAGWLAYIALLRSGAYRIKVQAELITLRKYLALATGRKEQEIQDLAEEFAR